MRAFKGFQLRFHPSETQYPISIRTEGNLPIGYRTTGKVSYDGTTYYVETYSFVYKENGAIGLGHCCFPKATALGYHVGDVERISLFYESETASEPKMVYFSAHSRGQGTMVPYHECEKSEDGCLVAYIALSSHAAYPRCGTYWRIFGFANDRCSSTGRCISITNFESLTAITMTPSGIMVKPKLEQPPVKNISVWERFCLAFYVDKLRKAP